MTKVKIVIASGKGGTGKTLISTNLARIISDIGEKVHYIDCDVEEPNGHLFLNPKNNQEEVIRLLSPAGVDDAKCTKCGKCAEVCHYNAIAVVKDKVLFFKELCHLCGACQIVCPVDAIVEKERSIGKLRHGVSEKIDFHDGLLATAEGGMSPRLIRKLKTYISEGINILDSPPGTACPVVETIKDADLCVLVTDPTPFGIHDLKLAVAMARSLKKEPVIIVNRASYNRLDLDEYCQAQQLEIVGEISNDRKIAHFYSRGDLIIDELPEYKVLFKKIAARIIESSKHERQVKKPAEESYFFQARQVIKKSLESDEMHGKRPKEVVIISGKGGTGKTSLAASLSALDHSMVIADCDVDAADLHLILKPKIKESGYFSGGVSAKIIQEKCTACGKCKDACRFLAIEKEVKKGKTKYYINPVDCEGCGVCYLVCPENAIEIHDAINGEWFISETRFGPMSHARLGIAEENSGRLVTLVRDHAVNLAKEKKLGKNLIDGSPGTGCPVIASLTAADYAVIVTEPTVSGLHDMKRVIDLVNYFGMKAGVVVNKFNINKNMTGKIKEEASKAGINMLGFIPYDEIVTLAQIKAQSVVEHDPKSEVAKEIIKVNKSIKDEIASNK
ncbi:MAG: P-loop NTPase [Atribacterota bacterium]